MHGFDSSIQHMMDGRRTTARRSHIHYMYVRSYVQPYVHTDLFGLAVIRIHRPIASVSFFASAKDGCMRGGA